MKDYINYMDMNISNYKKNAWIRSSIFFCITINAITRLLIELIFVYLKKNNNNDKKRRVKARELRLCFSFRSNI